MAEIVYLLCALTSIACGVMLFMGYRRSGARFLLWSSLCFAGLMINNLMLFTDKVLFPHIDLFVPAVRGLPALVGLMLLLYGLIWDAE
jgi:ABC-type amino acid transport system permease subunit